MTTEDDFQAKLDSNPDDWQTRLVLADFLEDRGDPRAEGYRALGRLKKFPYKQNIAFSDWTFHGSSCECCRENILPADWYRALSGQQSLWHAWPEIRDRKPRREVEDAAAMAFAKLPAGRRARLLKPKVAV